jgi:ribosome-associated translation inhibitor RaiA
MFLKLAYLAFISAIRMLHRLENKHKTKSQDKGEEKMNK